jgi:hypothetical protein
MSDSYFLPPPPVVRQHTRETCWAACIASIVNAAASGEAGPWYGGGKTGSVAPLDSEAVLWHVKNEEAAAGQMLHPVTGALQGEGWQPVARMFGLARPEFCFTPNLSSALINRLPDLLNQQNYVVLFFTREAWGKDLNGNPYFHARVLHAYFKPRGSGKTIFRGMDPDIAQPDFVEEAFDPGLKYIVSWRHATLRAPHL